MELKMDNHSDIPTIDRIYPVNTPAVCKAVIRSMENNTRTFWELEGIVERSQYKKPITHYNLKYKPYILHHGTLGFAPTDDEKYPEFSVKFTHHNPYYSINFTEILDPFLASILLDETQKMRLVCGSLDKKNIYLYQCRLWQSESYIRRKDSSGQISRTYNGLWTKATLENETGILLYTSEKDYICSLAASATDRQEFIAIACESGEIKYAALIDDKLTPWITINHDHANPNNTFEVLSANGLLIAHHQDRLLIMNMETGLQILDLKMSLFNPTISASDKYLNALVKQEGNTSDKAFVYEFASQSYKIIELGQTISDYVMGYKDIVCYVENNQLFYANTIEALIQPKSKASDLGVFSKSSKPAAKPHKSHRCTIF